MSLMFIFNILVICGTKHSSIILPQSVRDEGGLPDIAHVSGSAFSWDTWYNDADLRSSVQRLRQYLTASRIFANEIVIALRISFMSSARVE